MAPESAMPTSSRNGFCATLGYQIQLLLRKNFAIQQRNFVSTVAQFTLPLMMRESIQPWRSQHLSPLSALLLQR